MTLPTPKTAADARQVLADLNAKREGLTRAIGASADQRKAYAAPAEFGDLAAAEALRSLAVEETQNRAALENLDLVIAQLQRLHDDLHASETRAAAEQHARQESDALSTAIAELLDVDDELDDMLEHIRSLLAYRKQLNSNPRLVAARRRGRGTMISDRQIGRILLEYFAEYTGPAAAMNLSYAGITRFAEMDGAELGQKSHRTEERGPRPLTITERALLNSLNDVGLPIVGTDPRGWPRGWSDAPRPPDPGLFHTGNDQAGVPIFSRRRPDGKTGARLSR